MREFPVRPDLVDIMNNAGYEYDGGSRLRTRMVSIDGSTVYQSLYTYDLMDRLETYLPPAPSGHGYLTYEYNALGQKTSITNGSVAVNYDYYAKAGSRGSGVGRAWSRSIPMMHPGTGPGSTWGTGHQLSTTMTPIPGIG